MTTQRDRFFKTIGDAYKNGRDDLVILTVDMGAASLNEFKKDKNFLFNLGPVEQLSIDMAIGLALKGKKPYTYMITPFVLRALEQIRLLCSMNLPVVITSVGAGLSYDTAGVTHHGTEDLNIMRCLPNMTIVNVSSLEMAEYYAKISLDFETPLYIRLDKYQDDGIIPNEEGFFYYRIPSNNYPIVITTGVITNYLKSMLPLDFGLMEIYNFPCKENNILACIEQTPWYNKLISVEESYKIGGIGDYLSSLGLNVTKIGFDNFCEAKPREEYWKYLLRETLNV